MNESTMSPPLVSDIVTVSMSKNTTSTSFGSLLRKKMYLCMEIDRISHCFDRVSVLPVTLSLSEQQNNCMHISLLLCAVTLVNIFTLTLQRTLSGQRSLHQTGVLELYCHHAISSKGRTSIMKPSPSHICTTILTC